MACAFNAAPSLPKPAQGDKPRPVPTPPITWTPDRAAVELIDQTALPGALRLVRATTVEEVALAIRTMQVRGAPLIGVAAAFGFALAMRTNANVDAVADLLLATRPTAVNLRAAVEKIRAELLTSNDRAAKAMTLALELEAHERDLGRRLAEAGLPLLKGKPGRPVQVMTHCNAGWLATVEWGTALAPIYLAHQRGLAVHVWVSETRPRNQGQLTAWELRDAGIPHTFFVDNAAGLLMQRGEIDVCLVGTDRTSANGDVCNKVGTYLKALAAHAHGVPFYAAVPSTSIDWELEDGVTDTPIEQREATEVGEFPKGTDVSNFAFDVTPAKLMTGLITERGVCEASREGLRRLFA